MLWLFGYCWVWPWAADWVFARHSLGFFPFQMQNSARDDRGRLGCSTKTVDGDLICDTCQSLVDDQNPTINISQDERSTETLRACMARLFCPSRLH